MTKVHFKGKEIHIRLSIGKSESGAPSIIKTIYNKESYLLKILELEEAPAHHSIFKIGLDSDEKDYKSYYRVSSVDKVVDGNKLRYIAHVTNQDKEVIDKDEAEIIQKYYDLELDKHLKHLHETSNEFKAFEEFLGEEIDMLSNDEIMAKYDGFTKMVDYRIARDKRNNNGITINSSGMIFTDLTAGNFPDGVSAVGNNLLHAGHYSGGTIKADGCTVVGNSADKLW